MHACFLFFPVFSWPPGLPTLGFWVWRSRSFLPVSKHTACCLWVAHGQHSVCPGVLERMFWREGHSLVESKLKMDVCYHTSCRMQLKSLSGYSGYWFYASIILCPLTVWATQWMLIFKKYILSKLSCLQLFP